MKELLKPKNISLLIAVAGVCAIAVIAIRSKAQPSSNTGVQPPKSMQGMQRRQGPKPAENVKKKELKKFISINQEMRKMQMESQKDMQKAITDQGLTTKRYSKIARAQRDTSIDVDPSKKEMQKMQQASNEMQKIQMDMNEKSKKIIQDEGLTPTRYQQIGMALRQDQQLQQRYKKMMQQQTQAPMPQQRGPAPGPQKKQ